MTFEDLKEEIAIEMELLHTIITELRSLQEDVGGREATLREKTAAAAFLAQFYGGIENILKRFCRFHGLALPAGDTWHADLFRWFCNPSYGPLPVLFDEDLERRMAPYRKFRHVAFHSYGTQMDWSRLREGIDGVEDVFGKFRENLAIALTRN